MLGLALLLPARAHAQPRSVEAVPVGAGETVRHDGVLDEPIWERAHPATDFIQQEPVSGAPATDRTEVRLAFDADNLYVGVLCFQDPTRILTTTLRRDFNHNDSDTFGFILDTFNDDRNGFVFVVTPDGAQRETQVTNDGANVNQDWNAVWDVRTHRSDVGWSAEIVIPFKSLRFPPGSDRWGLNFSRRVRHKNEVSYWTLIKRPHSMTQVSQAGDLVGLADFEPGRNLKVTPFSLARGAYGSRRGGDLEAGLDLKYGISTRATLDLTLNTDFSEVEVDTQQVNLTRFPLFFPEKRPFFLESADLFHFGVRPNEKGGGTAGEEFIGFFSRRIGLSPSGTPLPILGGARVTGRSGAYSYGALHVSTRDDEETGVPAAHYSIGRAKRNIFENSDAGAMVMSRQGANGDFTRVVGGDVNLQFWRRLNLTSFLAKSFSEQQTGGKTHAAKVFGGWTDDRLDVFGTWIELGQDFDNSMSYVPRRDIRMFRGEVNVRRRPKIPFIREIHPHVATRYILDGDLQLSTKRQHIGVWTYFHDGSRLEVFQQHDFERLERAFGIHPGVVLVPRDYRFTSHTVQYYHDPTQTLSGAANVQWGEFWTGTILSREVRGSVRVRPRFLLEGRYEHNRVRLLEGDFDTHLGTLRVSQGFSTRQFADLLLQYNSVDESFSYQARYNLIHRPLSDLFVVASETRDYFLNQRVRTLTVKFNRLLDF